MTAILTCIQGDLLAQDDCDAIVNAANAELLPGGGVCGAIHDAAGPELARYCAGLGSIAVGGAVATPGFNLKQRWVIHACGPRYGFDRPSDKLLADAFRNALDAAERKQVKRIAFPAISTGIYGYPLDEAARVTVAAIRACLPALGSVEEVRLVLRDAQTWRVFGAEVGC
ncbi:O-acetyl-ADP-ribose deacetylase (regulator of RNase III), contains Macro domain [Formivibrio citricus]|uniref:O-acetyl-ADP-ribose deacetylase (Regulator of RNase III), contains Macro domain n=1 Tax=Formivibrio citricus TaxID=83765 RepID=A0A1I5D8V6_9NEIS|nr:macro domain-containing protein [Formivibrio citricus]SFN95642.1 O-acetyl-ADP-ribose deacetylase (regulator of RNase III), contains Macro domain [Formivibrio citricus]